MNIRSISPLPSISRHLQQGLLPVFSLPLVLLLASCASVPDNTDFRDSGVDWVHNIEASCSIQPERDELADSVGDDPSDLQFAKRISAIETTLTRRPLVAGNSITLLEDGPTTHAAQFKAIKEAQHHIHMDIYIFTDDDLGADYRQLLKNKARSGVKVRVIYDSIGAFSTSSSFINDLEDAGVDLHEYNSVNPLKNPRIWRINRRDHRKMLIVDGNTAFTGGINITDEYKQEAGESDDDGIEGWRDTHIRVQGPAVAEFQRLFISNWESFEGPIDVSPKYWPEPVNVGNNLVRVVTNHGSDFVEIFTRPGEQLLDEIRGRTRKHQHAIYQTYLSAMDEARQRIWITQAYFAPSRKFIDTLKNAAARGVDVRLLTPGESDIGLLLHASRFYYEELLEAGIKLYEYDASIIHSKTAVIDGVWATVGSSNLDFRSFIHNDEANAVIIGREFGQQMEEMFERDLANAREIDAETWAERGLFEKLKQNSAVLIKYWI